MPVVFKVKAGMSREPDSKVRAAEAVLGLRCPECGHAVYPCHSADAFLFYCRSGHPAALDDLAGIPDDAVREALGLMLRSWESTLGELENITADASRRGLCDVARIYQRRIGHLKTRIQTVRSALWASSPRQRA